MILRACLSFDLLDARDEFFHVAPPVVLEYTLVRCRQVVAVDLPAKKCRDFLALKRLPQIPYGGEWGKGHGACV
jgi:hypothetical protein